VSPTRRLFVLVLTVAALATTAFILPLDAVPAAVGRVGLLAPVAGVVVGAALLVALVPRTPVSVACGLVFGAGLGAVCALALALVAAGITFGLGRMLGRDFVARRAGRRWHRLESWIAREGVFAVAAVRALPLGPYGLIGYAYGASAVRVRDYGLGTLISATPSAVTYALLGAAIGGGTVASSLTLLPLACGLVLAALVAIRTRRHPLVARQPVAGGRRVVPSPVAWTAGDPVPVEVEP
jgi:uncharacterized membrane protein YdjX (TVP38/TMEM64 family)